MALRAALTAWVVAILAAGPASAGGLYLSTFGGPSMATASAGAEALAVDASTALHNPAGMTRLGDHQILGALAPGFTTTKFDPDPGSPAGIVDGGEQGGFVPVSSGNYVHRLSERLRLGVSMFSMSGAGLDPTNGWAGRNEITDVFLFTLTFQPTVAVRITDWLSVGGGAAISYGRLDFDLRAPGPLGAFIKLDELDDWAVAPVASVLVELTDDLRVGVKYLGETDFELDGDVKLPLGIDAGIHLDLPLAQAVRAGAIWEATDSLTLLAGGGWEDWSEAENLPVSVAAGSAAVPLGFRDTWYVSGGVHYRLDETWNLKAGVRYDSSALQDSKRTTAFPIDRVWTLGVGTDYAWSENLALHFSFAWADLGRAPVKTTFVTGDYRRNDLFLFGVALQWRKLPWSGRATF